MWTEADIAAQEAREEHHDNRYEDGVPFYTGTVEDYGDWWQDDVRYFAARDCGPAPATSTTTRAEHVRPGDTLAGLRVVAHDPNVDGYVEIVTEDGRERFFRRGSLVTIVPAAARG